LGIDTDSQQFIYIADCKNHRIVKCKFGQTDVEIIAGGNGKGNKIDQLNEPTDVIVDQKNKSLIICDQGNRRVILSSLQNPNDKQILIQNICGSRLTMNENGDLFVADFDKHVVKRWRKDEQGEERTIVAGGNGKGNQLNQLNRPSFVFVDREETIYVSDCLNQRVMKWMKNAQEGIVVAGGNGQGHGLNQLNSPEGLIVNEVGDIYVADCGNDRIMCWKYGLKQGEFVVAGNGKGNQPNQLSWPTGLSFDVENNLYVADLTNNRIQRFEIDQN